MKAEVEQQVPLAPDVVALLRALARSSDYVFPGQEEGRPLSDMSLSALLRRLKRDDITVHSFAQPSASGMRRPWATLIRARYVNTL
jgi:integrase